MDFTKTIKTLKLLLATVLVGSASLSANATTFYDNASGLKFETNSSTTCTVSDSGAYGDITIPSTATYNGTEYKVTSIKISAFQSNKKLTSVTISEGVDSIGYGAFSYCYNLKSVKIPESVNYMGGCAFYDCTSLTTVNIPEGVSFIASAIFYECRSLTSITIPESVTFIERAAFQDCTKLTSITIPDNVKTIGDYAFANCYNLVNIDLGEGVETIGDKAFYYCDSLKGTYTNEFTGEYQNVLIIPNSVKTIGDGAFEDCYALENIWIGNGCTSVGENAFYNDKTSSSSHILKTVSCMANPAPIIAAQNAFNDIDYTNAYLYIPKGETDEETQAIYDDYVDESNYWRLFLKGATSIDADGNNGISVGVGEVENDDIAVTTDGKAIEITGYEGEINVYNVAGMKVYQGTDNRIELPNEGIYVVIVNDKPYKLAIK